MSIYPTVMIGGICQNKSWAIEDHLDAIFVQDYPKDKISLVYYLNDSTDGTKEKLLGKLKAAKESGEYRRVQVVEQNWGLFDKRSMRVLEYKNYKDRRTFNAVANFAHFALLRNEWLKLRVDEDYYFSVDADVIIDKPNSLTRLLSHGVDAVAIPVDNSHNRSDGYSPSKEALARILKGQTPENREFLLMCARGEIQGATVGPKAVWNFGMMRGYELVRFDVAPLLFEVDMTGACILFNSKLVEAGVEYGPHYYGEDIYFCSLARTYGFKFFVDGLLSTSHAMDVKPLRKLEQGVTV